MSRFFAWHLWPAYLFGVGVAGLWVCVVGLAWPDIRRAGLTNIEGDGSDRQRET